jgi:hypothetical protein
MRSAAVLLLGIHMLAARNVEAASPYRGTAAFPSSIEALSTALVLGHSDPATVLLRAIRLVYGKSESSGQHARQALSCVLQKSAAGGTERVPLPLTLQLWSDVIHRAAVDDRSVVRAILTDRSASLLYYGVSALDDET